MLTYNLIPALLFDFGYEWKWVYSHLIPLTIGAVLLFFAIRYRWNRILTVILGLVTLWSLAGFLALQFAVGPNRPMSLPTQKFLASGTGKVLDVGAGSGRSALMVLQARPQATLVALDKFAQGFGIENNGPQRLLANLKEGGVDGRVEIVSADMREMPLPAESFDAALSAFAIDHLGRGGFRSALGEVRRVLKPGGEFLFLTIQRDLWITVAYPFFVHGGYFGPAPSPDRWTAALSEGGFDVVETGTIPGALYILCRKR